MPTCPLSRYGPPQKQNHASGSLYIYTNHYRNQHEISILLADYLLFLVAVLCRKTKIQIILINKSSYYLGLLINNRLVTSSFIALYVSASLFPLKSFAVLSVTNVTPNTVLEYSATTSA